MKFILSLLLMALLSFTACLYMDWWSIALACFIVAAFIRQRPGIAFLTGFLALFMLWAGISFFISNNNEHLLAHKVSILLLKTDNPLLLIIFTGCIGGLVGAFAALTGSLLRMKPSAKIKS
ncbi:MAG: hypothetical protein ABIN36_07765 [Ferruginibacter sp.]